MGFALFVLQIYHYYWVKKFGNEKYVDEEIKDKLAINENDCGINSRVENECVENKKNNTIIVENFVWLLVRGRGAKQICYPLPQIRS